ncbi:MAG: hypothetical protein H8E94_09575, partial [Alphaproteobacteria bacterium]|nr:hypothetical protein [Alphaproteobacteria bacterium]
GEGGEGQHIAILPKIREAVEKAEAALKSGDWTTFGTAMTEVKRLLDQTKTPETPPQPPAQTN